MLVTNSATERQTDRGRTRPMIIGRCDACIYNRIKTKQVQTGRIHEKVTTQGRLENNSKDFVIL